MTPWVSKGGVLHTQWELYTPGSLVIADPDDFPEAPRFTLYASDNNPVDGYDELPYTIRRGLGVFALDLPIPFSDDVLPAATDYQLRLTRGTIGGLAPVDSSGSPLVATFSIAPLPKEEDYSSQRPYVTPQQVASDFGVSPAPTLAEVLFAQQLIDDWCHRPSLWPTVIERERHKLMTDRNLFSLAYGPIIRIFSAQTGNSAATAPVVGRYGYGRHDRRAMNLSGGAFVASMAILGSPPTFVPIAPNAIDFHPDTRECWIPTGLFLINYTEVEVTYEAGYRVIPFSVKMALAETLAWVRVKGFGPLTSWSVGRVSHTTGESLITPEVAARLEKYRVKTLA